MKKTMYHINLTDEEQRSLIKSLIKFKNGLIEQGKYTDAVDDVLIKIAGAKKKKFKII